MSSVFFDDVLLAIGKRVDYEAVSNYAGNSFCKDSWKMIQDCNPLRKSGGSDMKGFVDLLNNGGLKMMTAKEAEE